MRDYVSYLYSANYRFEPEVNLVWDDYCKLDFLAFENVWKLIKKQEVEKLGNNANELWVCGKLPRNANTRSALVSFLVLVGEYQIKIVEITSLADVCS